MFFKWEVGCRLMIGRALLAGGPELGLIEVAFTVSSLLEGWIVTSPQIFHRVILVPDGEG